MCIGPDFHPHIAIFNRGDWIPVPTFRKTVAMCGRARSGLHDCSPLLATMQLLGLFVAVLLSLDDDASLCCRQLPPKRGRNIWLQAN